MIAVEPSEPARAFLRHACIFRIRAQRSSVPIHGTRIEIMKGVFMRVLVFTSVFLSLMILPCAAGAASCSARCTGCSGSSPDCSTGSCAAVYCQNGQCGGLHVGCCCNNTGAYLCLDVPCSSGKLDPKDPPALTGPGGDWAIIEYTVDSEGVVVAGPSIPFASSSSYGTRVVSESYSPGERTSQPEGSYFRLVLDSVAPDRPGAPRVDVRSLEERLGDLGLDERKTGRFAIRVSGRQVEVLFTTNPALSESALPAFTLDEPGRTLDGGVYLVGFADGRVGIVHTR